MSRSNALFGPSAVFSVVLSVASCGTDHRDVRIEREVVSSTQVSFVAANAFCAAYLDITSATLENLKDWHARLDDMTAQYIELAPAELREAVKTQIASARRLKRIYQRHDYDRDAVERDPEFLVAQSDFAVVEANLDLNAYAWEHCRAG